MALHDTRRLYKTSTPLQRELRVRYPANGAHITIRTELDWEKDLEPQRVEETGPSAILG